MLTLKSLKILPSKLSMMCFDKRNFSFSSSKLVLSYTFNEKYNDKSSARPITIIMNTFLCFWENENVLNPYSVTRWIGITEKNYQKWK